MKIKNITEPQKFFEVLNECKGRVELVTSEGDRLNMKSTLCQYIALTQMFKDARSAEENNERGLFEYYLPEQVERKN